MAGCGLRQRKSDRRYDLEGSGLVEAVELGSGNVRWQWEMGASVGAAVLAGDKLVVVGYEQRYSKPFVASLGPASGEAEWRHPLEKSAGGGDAYHVRLAGDRLTLVTDKEVATYRLAAPPERLWATAFRGRLREAPVVAGDTVYTCLWEGGLQATDLPDGAQAAPLSAPGLNGCLALAGDMVFGLSRSGGLLTAWDLRDSLPPLPPPPPPLGLSPTDLRHALHPVQPGLLRPPLRWSAYIPRSTEE